MCRIDERVCEARERARRVVDAGLPLRSEGTSHSDDLSLEEGEIDERIVYVRVVLVLPREVVGAHLRAAPMLRLEARDLVPKFRPPLHQLVGHGQPYPDR